MENRINNRVIITVNKRNKLLGYLKKLNSGDTEGVSVKITHKPKEEPVHLFFTRGFSKNGTVDNFLVYANYGKAESKRTVLLGNATIISLQKSGLKPAGNKESKECVAINVYAKEDALDFKELQDILFSIKQLSTYSLINTSIAMLIDILIELKPENKNFIGYEVSMLPNNPLEPTAVKRAISMLAVKRAIDSATDMVHSAEQNLPNYACHSKNSNSTVTESERHILEKRHMLEALKRMHNTDNRKSDNIEFELVITLSMLVVALSMLRSDLEKPLKRWKKILNAKPIEVLTDTFLRVGHVVDFYIRESSIRVGRGANTGLMTGYELVAKYSLNENVVNTIKKDTIISGLVFKALHNAHAEYKQRKSENLDISHLESLLEKNQKTSNQERDKDLIGIIAESLREIGGINKTSVNKCSKTAASEDLFCKKAKVNSNNNDNTIRAYRPYQVPNPVVTILASDESKDKVKEIIEEANKTKRFPYMLDYDSNCVVRISDNLFDILECKNKLEDILRIRKDIDVGIFALESTEGLVFKKLFNISSLTVYHSASKNLYALIGIY